MKQQLKLSIPIAIENIINTLMTSIDVLVLVLLGTEYITAVGSMLIILNLIQLPIEALSNTNVIQLSRENRTQITSNSLVIAIAITIPLSILTIIISPLFPSLFNVSNLCNTYLIIRIFGLIPNSITTILSGHQRATNHQIKICVIRIIALIINFLTNIILIKHNYSIKEIAISTVVIETLIAVYLLYITRPKITYNKYIIINLLNQFKWRVLEKSATKIDDFAINLLVATLGSVQYSIYIIMYQMYAIFEAFINGYNEGFEINLASNIKHHQTEEAKNKIQINKKCITLERIFLIPLLAFITYMYGVYTLVDYQSKQLLYLVEPLVLITLFYTIKGGFYTPILRTLKHQKFLALRNIISSTIKFIIAFTMSYYVTGLYGIWIAFIIYEISNCIQAKKYYQKLANKNSWLNQITMI